MSFQVRIWDADAMREIAPAALRAYALAQGWKRVESFGDHSDVYIFEGAGEAILPGSASLADYARVVSDVIALFARTENRDELQVYRDLSTADQDVIRIRAPEAEDDGSIKLEAGVELVTEARNLLLSAACSTTDPRRAYRAGRIKEASEYIEKVRLGQTERGSFIVTLLSPVPPALEPTAPTLWPLPSDEPFERQVTRRLVDGLEAARDAIERANRGAQFSVFEEAVRRGVSANLCEAAASLIERGHGLDVSVTWAQTRRAPEKRRSVVFTPSDADVLKEAARVFRDREPRPDETLEGFIVKLARNEPLEIDGRATLKTFVDEHPAAVRMDLPQDIYEEAVRAHEKGQAISIRGDLVREGHRWRLKHPHDLSVSETDDEADESSI